MSETVAGAFWTDVRCWSWPALGLRCAVDWVLAVISRSLCGRAGARSSATTVAIGELEDSVLPVPTLPIASAVICAMLSLV